MVQQREKRMGRNPATGARVAIPAKQVVKARIAKGCTTRKLGFAVRRALIGRFLLRNSPVAH